MSLKAKLEAVIYAAEEPVTLTQLAALFAADALDWKAEQAAAAAELAAEVAGQTPEIGQPLPLLSEGLEYLGLEDSPAVYADRPPEAAAPEPAAEPVETPGAVDTPPETAPETVSVTPDREPGAAEDTESVAQAAEGATEAPAAPVVDAEAEARRLARQRDREVKGVLKQLLDELIASTASDGRGVEVREIAGGYRMATKPECHDAVRLFVKSLKPAMKLSLPALETLAVIAYKQPVTAPEVNDIRGVESAGVLGSLLARKLIATAGRKPVIGRPILYKTTREFLLRFGLKDVAELPSMEEFEKMAAIEMEEEMEPEATQADQTLSEAEANEESDLESNSPSGVELAGETAEATEAAEALAMEEDAPATEETQETSTDSTAVMAAETTPAEMAERTTNEGAPAEPDSNTQAETETIPHGEESKEER
jgi:segregation and condensation protein B